jgi:hypothetical protein
MHGRKGLLNSENAYEHSVQNRLSSRLLSEKQLNNGPKQEEVAAE